MVEEVLKESGGGGEVGGEAPQDKGWLVGWLCAWLGVVMLLPWNFYYTANAYWMYKFRALSTSLPLNETVPEFDSMQTFWNSSLSLVSMAPNFIFLFLNVIIGHKFRIQPRLYVALVVNILLFILSLVFTQVTTDSWQTGFYGMTLAFAMVFNINDSVFQGAFASLLGRFPMEYMSALSNGQAVGGAFASGCSVVFLAIGGTEQSVALFSFSLAALFLTSAVFVLLYVSKQPFYQFYLQDRQNTSKTTDGDSQTSDLPLVLRESWQFLLAVFLNFFVTLGVFPSLFALTVSEAEEDSAWWVKYFIPVGGFFTFNFCDLLGRFLSGMVKWPTATKSGAVTTLLFSILRLVFVPLFIFCNTNPTNRVNSQVYFHSDLAFFFINILFGLSNGYIANICLMSTPKMLKEPRHQSTAASLTVFLLVAGLLAGSGFSFLWVQLL